jgi:hypothetical protein
MMAVVRTDSGALVYKRDLSHSQGQLSQKEAEASAQQRNAEAEKLGIKTRYVVAEK